MLATEEKGTVNKCLRYENAALDVGYSGGLYVGAGVAFNDVVSLQGSSNTYANK